MARRVGQRFGVTRYPHFHPEVADIPERAEGNGAGTPGEALRDVPLGLVVGNGHDGLIGDDQLPVEDEEVECPAQSRSSRDDLPRLASAYHPSDVYAELFSDPDAHREDSVDIAGQLLERPEESGNELAFQMFVDVENADWNTICYQ